MSKTDARVAKRYAKALFDNCQSQNYQAVQSALFAIAEVVGEHSVKEAFINPALTHKQKANWLESIISELCPAEQKILNNLMLAVIENSRINLLNELAQYFSAYVDSYRKLLKLEVTSAKSLSQQESEQLSDSIKTKLPQELASQVSFEWQTDPALIAGIQVKVGDKIIDGSVETAIGKIARLLAN